MRRAVALLLLSFLGVLPFAAPARAQVKYQSSVKLSWKSRGEGYAYVIEIRSADKVVESKKIDKAEFAVRLPPGPYSYRLKTVDALGREGPWGQAVTFNVLLGPVMLTPDRITPVAKGVKADWVGLEFASSYVVRVYRGKELINELTVSSTQAMVPLPEPGVYQIEVAGLNNGVAGDVAHRYQFEIGEEFFDSPAKPEKKAAVDPNALALQRIRMETPSRFTGNAGINFSYLTYDEAAGGISMREVVVTGKGGITYKILPGALDAGLSAFGTLTDIAHSPTSLPMARFIGVNGRLGYRLPFSSSDLEWNTSLGWYYWRMHVADDAYGVKQLAGPQVFVTARIVPSRIVAYFKLAPISDAFGNAKISNHELAIGASYVMVPGSPVAATLDLSRTSFHSDKARNGMSMFTGSLGFSVSF